MLHQHNQDKITSGFFIPNPVKGEGTDHDRPAGKQFTSYKFFCYVTICKHSSSARPELLTLIQTAKYSLFPSKLLGIFPLR